MTSKDIGLVVCLVICGGVALAAAFSPNVIEPKKTTWNSPETWIPKEIREDPDPDAVTCRMEMRRVSACAHDPEARACGIAMASQYLDCLRLRKMKSQ